jgi:hypothetical protein
MKMQDLPRPKNITFEITPELIEKRDVMAAQMYLCPKRRNGNSLDQKIYQAQAGVFLEHALSLQGAELNEKEFDVKDVDSYFWDVKWHGLYTEVKRCKLNENSTWFSFYESQVKTMLNNINRLDLLIVGDYEIHEKNTCHVKWMLMTPVKSFKKNVKKSIYSEGKLYYNHNGESNCVMLMESA